MRRLRARAASDERAPEVVGAGVQRTGNGSGETAPPTICWDDELDWVAQTPHLDLLRRLKDYAEAWLAADPHDSMLTLEIAVMARRIGP